MISYTVKSHNTEKINFSKFHDEESEETVKNLPQHCTVSNIDKSLEINDINIIVAPKLKKSVPIYKTKLMTAIFIISALILICLIVGLSLYSHLSYIEYISFNWNQIYYYCNSEDFPELHNGNGPLEFGDLKNNLQHIKYLGVGTIIIENQHTYRTNYTYSPKVLSSFALESHDKGISVYFEWENIGTTRVNSNFDREFPHYCSKDELNGYKVLNYHIPEVYTIIHNSLKEFSHNYVDGYLFNDIPRIVDTITKNLTFETDSKALDVIRDKLNHILSSKMQMFARSIPTINYPSTLKDVNLDGYVYEIGSLTSLNNQDIFDEITRILNFQKILSDKALIIITTKTKFAQEMKLLKLDGIKLLAIFGFVPGSLLISPRIEFCGDSFINYTRALKNMSDVQINCSRSINELMTFRNNRLGSGFYKNFSTVLWEQNSLFMMRTRTLDTIPARLILLWNNLNTANNVDISLLAKIKDNEKISALYSSNKSFFHKMYSSNVVDLESLEVVILIIE